MSNRVNTSETATSGGVPSRSRAVDTSGGFYVLERKPQSMEEGIIKAFAAFGTLAVVAYLVFVVFTMVLPNIN